MGYEYKTVEQPIITDKHNPRPELDAMLNGGDDWEWRGEVTMGLHSSGSDSIKRFNVYRRKIK